MVEKKSAFQLAWEAKKLAKQQEKQAAVQAKREAIAAEKAVIQARRDWQTKVGDTLVSTPFAALLK